MSEADEIAARSTPANLGPLYRNFQGLPLSMQQILLPPPNPYAPQMKSAPEGNQFPTPPVIFNPPPRASAVPNLESIKKMGVLAGAGLEQAVGGTTEMLGRIFNVPSAVKAGKRMEAEAQASFIPEAFENEGEVAKAGMQAAPSLGVMLGTGVGSMINPAAGAAVGSALMAGQTFGQPNWDVSTGRRFLSTGLQTAVEYSTIGPEAWILASPLPPAIKAGLMAATNLAANPAQEGAQGEIGHVVERGHAPSLGRAMRTAREAIPATIALAGAGAALGALSGRGNPEVTPENLPIPMAVAKYLAYQEQKANEGPIDQPPVASGAVQPELEAKTAAVVGQGDPDITAWAKTLVETEREAWFEGKGRVIPHAVSKDRGEQIAARLGFDAEEVEKILKNPEFDQPAENLAAAQITSQVSIANAIESPTYKGFVEGIKNSVNLITAARVGVSLQARGLSMWKFLQEQADAGNDPAMAQTPITPQNLGDMIEATRDSVNETKKIPKEDRLSNEDIENILGGKDSLENLQNEIRKAKADGSFSLKNFQAALNAIVEGARKSKEKGIVWKAGYMPLEWFRAALLSGPTTDEVNVYSTGLNIAMHEALVGPMAAIINKGTKAPDQPSIQNQLKGAKNLGALLKPGSDLVALLKFNIAAEYPTAQLRQLVRATPFQQQMMLGFTQDRWRREQTPALPGAFGRGVRTFSFSKLSAEDGALRALVMRMETAAEMDRREVEWDGVSAVPADVLATTIAKADELVFTRRVDGLAQWMTKVIKGSYVGEWVVPFTQTITNIIRTGMTYTPGANFLVKSEREALATPHSRAQNEALARIALGTALWTLVASLRVGEDPDRYLSGVAPRESAQRNIWYLNNGNLAVKTPWRQYELSRTEPLNQVLGTMSGAVDAVLNKEAGAAGKVAGVVGAWLSAPLNSPLLAGVADLFEVKAAFDRGMEPGMKKAQGMVNRIGGVMVAPQILDQAAKFMDPYMRRVDSQNFGEVVQSRIPGMTQDLPAKLDLYGRPIPQSRYHDIFPAVPGRDIAGSRIGKALQDLGVGLEVPDWMKFVPEKEASQLLNDRMRQLEESYIDIVRLPKEEAIDLIEDIKRSWGNSRGVAVARSLARERQKREREQ